MANSKKATTVGAIATSSNALNTSSLSLLGVFGAEGRMQALIRLPGGRVRRVEPGDRVSGERIAAIDGDGLVLEHGGKTRRLTVAGG
ncbi:MAG: hypothetical protein GJ676_15990 [Rhodobacteraceae bacterium]|nr:hypothetical protein [Paracoccaceae bacterium]